MPAPSHEATTASLRRRRPVPLQGDVVSMEIISGDPATSPLLLNGRENTAREVALIVSSYRVVVIFHDERYKNIEVPCMAIDEVKEPKKLQKTTEEVHIVTKLPWDLRLAFPTRRDSQGLYNMLQALKRLLVMPDPTVSPLERLFAFEHARRYKDAYAKQNLEDGWEIFDVHKELARQTVGSHSPKGGKDEWSGRGIGVDLRPWFRVAKIECNEDDQGMFSPTYPSEFVVPVSATDKLLRAVAQYRSRARIPIVSWVSLKTGAMIARSSQPLAGVSSNRSHADEVVCETLLAQAYVPGGTPIPACFHDELPSLASAGPQPGRPPFSAPPSLTGAPPPSLSGPGLRRNGDSSTPTNAEIQAMKQQQERNKRPFTVIFDARSQMAARANIARGGGFETSKHYNCKIVFLQMENIHAVYDSWKKCKKVLERYNNRQSSSRNAVPGPQGPNVGFHTDWEKTNWVLHIQRLLYGSSRIVDEILSGASCLVHCSDGWDRTSQLTSLSMLMMDPFYRTVRGFCLLIEKEWCVAGHKFAERSGHQVEGKCSASKFKEGAGNELDENSVESGIAKHTKTGSGLEPGPIFLQWVDAVFQVTRQYPNAFEFTANLLEFIAESAYSCRFGTFLCNFDKERVMEGVKDRTVSLWTEVLRLVSEEKSTREPVYLNPFYEPAKKILRPTCNGKRLVLWESFYLRHDSEPYVSATDVDAVALHRQQLVKTRKGKDAMMSSDDEEEEEEANITMIRRQLDPSDVVESPRDAATLANQRESPFSGSQGEVDKIGAKPVARRTSQGEAAEKPVGDSYQAEWKQAQDEIAGLRRQLELARVAEQDASKREAEAHRKLATALRLAQPEGGIPSHVDPADPALFRPAVSLLSAPPPTNVVVPSPTAPSAAASGINSFSAPAPTTALSTTPPPPPPTAGDRVSRVVL